MSTEGQDIHGPPVADETATAAGDPWESLNALVRRCDRLPELPMKVGIVREALLDSDSATGVFLLDHLIRRAITGDGPAQTAWLCAVLFLIEASNDPAIYPRLSRWYEVASDEGRTHVGQVLLEAPPFKSVENPHGLQQARFDRAISLGEKRQLACGPDRAALDRLLSDLSPMVVRKLIGNPRILLADILNIATRRPNLAETLQELVRSHQWIVRYEVRLALINNPYAPTGTALKLLPTLRGRDLRRVAYAGDLHPSMASAAQCLLGIRGTRNLK